MKPRVPIIILGILLSIFIGLLIILFTKYKTLINLDKQRGPTPFISAEGNILAPGDYTMTDDKEKMLLIGRLKNLKKINEDVVANISLGQSKAGSEQERVVSFTLYSKAEGKAFFLLTQFVQDEYPLSKDYTETTFSDANSILSELKKRVGNSVSVFVNLNVTTNNCNRKLTQMVTEGLDSIDCSPRVYQMNIIKQK